MITSIKDLTGLKIAAKDGEIGKSKDFYFDDVGWNIRYLVVDTGPFILGRKVLISHYSFKQPDPGMNVLPINLTIEKIKNSPHIDNKLPVSRQKEMELAMYYQWPFYWMNMTAIPAQESSLLRNMWTQEAIDEKNKHRSVLEAHLRSYNELKGYSVQAVNDEIGFIDDFLVDDKTWKIRYLVLDSSKWLPGTENKLISPAWIETVDWTRNQIIVDQEADVIKNSPSYDKNENIDPEYEIELFKHYGKTN